MLQYLTDAPHAAPRDPLSVLDIWDFISGTTEGYPYEAKFASCLMQLITAEIGMSKRRILDLGGGSGNPSIAFALDGHHVDVVDVDNQFTDAAKRRAARINVAVNVITSDWRPFLKNVARGEKYDVIMCLGNAVAYQDSWPDHALPTGDPVDKLLETLRLCEAKLTPNGLIVLELTTEDLNVGPPSYLRFYPPIASPSPGEMRSVWLVKWSTRTGQRQVDTCIFEFTSAELATLRGRVVFNGWLFTRQALAEAARKCGLSVQFASDRCRPFFDVALLKRVGEK